MPLRVGRSLLEVIVVIAIIAILLAILIPAVQRAREAANWTSSANNLRQIQLCVQHFASNHDDRVPSLNGDLMGPNPGMSLQSVILPYLEQGAIYNALFMRGIPAGGRTYLVRPYVSPADPTLDLKLASSGYTSYAANAFAFQPGFTFAASYRDGTSNTIAFGEHYARCGQRHYIWTVDSIDHYPAMTIHRASFSDGGTAFGGSCYGDVYPVTKGWPPVSEPAFLPVGPHRPDTPVGAILQPILTPFQTAPAILDCHGLIPQTPHTRGMLTGLMDGSVRTLAPSTSMATFWGAVTPSGGEVLADW